MKGLQYYVVLRSFDRGLHIIFGIRAYKMIVMVVNVDTGPLQCAAVVHYSGGP